MVADSLNTFPGFLEDQAIASRTSLSGCTHDEINALEQRYSMILPATYRWYLATMGRKAGRLFTHDHLAVTYSYVLEMNDEFRSQAGSHSELKDISLPTDALIILGRLGDQFEFIRCCDPNDWPVWYFNTWDREIKMVHTSVLEWLNSCASAAVEAIASGYFDDFPDGTRP